VVITNEDIEVHEEKANAMIDVGRHRP